MIPVVARYPTNAELCDCCLSVILNLNIDSVSRKSLLQQKSLSLLLSITNYCQKEASIIQRAMQVIRSICSAERR